MYITFYVDNIYSCEVENLTFINITTNEEQKMLAKGGNDTFKILKETKSYSLWFLFVTILIYVILYSILVFSRLTNIITLYF